MLHSSLPFRSMSQNRCRLTDSLMWIAWVASCQSYLEIWGKLILRSPQLWDWERFVSLTRRHHHPSPLIWWLSTKHRINRELQTSNSLDTNCNTLHHCFVEHGDDIQESDLASTWLNCLQLEFSPLNATTPEVSSGGVSLLSVGLLTTFDNNTSHSTQHSTQHLARVLPSFSKLSLTCSSMSSKESLHVRMYSFPWRRRSTD